jgi:hypothetical protein
VISYCITWKKRPNGKDYKTGRKGKEAKLPYFVTAHLGADQSKMMKTLISL